MAIKLRLIADFMLKKELHHDYWSINRIIDVNIYHDVGVDMQELAPNIHINIMINIHINDPIWGSSVSTDRWACGYAEGF